MRVIVIASSTFGERCLRRLAMNRGVQIVGVITSERRFTISYSPDGVENVLHADLVSVANEFGLPSYVMKSKMTEPPLLDFAAQLRPDWFLVAGWYHMIPKSLRDLAPAYGMHASLLPDYSGGAPLVWAMINGETRTGMTLFLMDGGVDSGPIVSQVEVPIYNDDSIADLYSRVEQAGIELVSRFAPRLGTDDLVLIDQDESCRRVMPQRAPKDGEIDWNQSTLDIDRFIRAQTRPYPGAFTHIHGRKVQIWRARSALSFEPASGKPAGTVFFEDGFTLIATTDGALQLVEIEIDRRCLVDTDIEKALSPFN